MDTSVSIGIDGHPPIKGGVRTSYLERKLQMATLVNRNNPEVKVIIPNMREFRTFYSDSEGVIGMFFKRDWEEVKESSK